MKKSLYIALISLMTLPSAFAQIGAVRSGAAGFTQLLINGWGRSSGMGNSFNAGVEGVEAFYQNIAGIANTKGTDIGFSRTNWLVGTNININTFGFTQKLKGSGVLGLSVMSFGVGQIPITTVQQPDGGIGTYKPSISNVNLGYAYSFGNGISGGVNFKIVSESTPDVRTGGVAFDAGIQYGTQLMKNSSNKGIEAKYRSDNPAAQRINDMRFGVSIKNLGPDTRYSGDGLATRSNIGSNIYTTTTSQRSERVALPSIINIGFAYDFRLDKNPDLYYHRLTTAINFTNNNFARQQTSIGVEYAYKEILMLRAGFDYEKGIFDYETRATAFTGPAAGATVQLGLGKKTESKLAVDYSYRATNPFGGTHTIGLRVILGQKED